MQSYKTIAEYVKGQGKGARAFIQEMRTLCKELVPEGEEAIRYGIPTIRLHDTNLIHFAVMKSHFGFYPSSSGVKVFEKDLKKMKIDYSKGCIRFPYGTPLPISLIKKIILFRIKEVKALSK